MRILARAALALAIVGALNMQAACSAEPVLAVAAPEGADLWAQFADDEGRVIVTSSDDKIEQYSSSGELVWQSSTVGFVPPGESAFLLVDDGRLLLRSGAGYGVVPMTDRPGQVAQAVLEWLDLAGGLLEDVDPPQSTNDTNGWSCAVGADRSIAAWKHSIPNSFWASPPEALDPNIGVIAQLFCLEAGGMPFVAVSGIDRRSDAPGKRRMVLYQMGPTESEAVHEFSLSDWSGEILRFHAFAGGVGLVMRSASGGLMAIRVAFRDGAWTSERASLTGEWSSGDWRSIAIRADHVWLSDPRTARVVRVAWPAGAAEIPFEIDRSIVAEGAVRRGAISGGRVIPSPDDRQLLWVDFESDRLVLDQAE